MSRAEVTQQYVGINGESTAVAYLERNGYIILDKNYRSKAGEIDIVCLNTMLESGSPELVFVEVKARRSKQYGEPVEAVTDEKLLRIRKAAEVYMMRYNQDDLTCRFDVIGVLFGENGAQIKHYQDVLDY